MASGIAELVGRRAFDDPSAAAVVEGRTGRCLTWGSLAVRLHEGAGGLGPPGLPVVIQDPDPLGFLAGGAVVIPVEPEAPKGDAEGLIEAFRAAQPGSVVLRTSGTTGTAKGVPLDEARLLRAARLVAGHHGFTSRDVVYSPLPLFHVNAQVVGVLAALVSGARLVVDDRFHRNGFWEV